MRNALTAVLAAALAGRAAIVFARGVGDTALLRAAAAESAMVLLVVVPTVPLPDKAMLLAAIGPLAAELAPYVRIAALDVAQGADPDDAVAAALFLATAESTTGQVLRVTPR